jgi:hypothetical protein
LVKAQYGGQVQEALNTELTGTLTVQGGTASTFTLTAKKRILRFEIRQGTETVRFVRHDSRVQKTAGGKTGFVDRIPVSYSVVNYAPIVALLETHSDERFTGTVVVAADGFLGLKYTEGTPPGFTPPVFDPPRLVVTFWLDTGYRVTSASYGYDKDSSHIVNYLYFYDLPVAGPFLQPSKVETYVGTKLLSVAEVLATRKDVAVAADHFKLLELWER